MPSKSQTRSIIRAVTNVNLCPNPTLQPEVLDVSNEGGQSYIRTSDNNQRHGKAMLLSPAHLPRTDLATTKRRQYSWHQAFR